MFRHIIRRLISWRPKLIAAKRVTQTAPRRIAGVGRKVGRQKARDRYVEIAAALKAEVCVDAHTVNKGLSGRAWLGKGISICPMAQEFAAGRRSPYASLRAVDSQRRQKVSAYGTVGCATCRNREGSQCTVHFGDLSYAWRNACNRGQSWRPLRRAVIAKLARDFVRILAVIKG